MIYSNKQPSFNLSSKWQCDWDAAGYGVEWYISSPPTTDGRTITFSVALPFDAVISRVWLTMGVGSPISGAKVRKVNGYSIPLDGVVELEKDVITASTTSFTASFTFRANGMVYEDTNEHQASLAIDEPTLHVEYSSVSNPDGGEDEEEIVVTANGDGLQLPRLLGSDFKETARLEPYSLRIELTIDPKSTAVMRLTHDQPVVKVGDFIEIFSPHWTVP